MTQFEEKIYKEIQKAQGIKGSEIAAKLGVEKREVNSTLSKSTALRALVRQESNYKWYVINTQGGSQTGTVANLPKADEDLKNLCNYYLNCLTMEASSSVSQFLTSNYSLQYSVLNGLNIDSDVDVESINLLKKISSNRNSRAYIGYPVRLYTFYSKKGQPYRKIAPVFIFPIEYFGGSIDVSWTPSVNMEVVKAFCDGNSDSLSVELVNLETELGMNTPDADIEVDELVIKLHQIRQWDWKETIDPYNIPSAEDLGQFEDGIYNRPIIIEAEREKYTLGLESELMTLANMPEENYKGTALYSWVKGHSFEKQNEDGRPLLEVLPLNSEQSLAVSTALNSNLTIVTGPPGTGKSQVVTDLLINIAWNGKSALFSSKNNKAVDVVDARVNGLCKRPVLLRIGSNQYASRMAEIIDGLLCSRPTATDSEDVQYYIKEYNSIAEGSEDLQKEKQEIIGIRNEVDRLEQKYCTIRSEIDWCFDTIEKKDCGNVSSVARNFEAAYHKAQKDEQGFFTRLLWSFYSKQREEEANEKAQAYNFYAEKYKLDKASVSLSASEVNSLVSNADRFDDAISIAVEYKDKLQKLSSAKNIENFDRKLSNNKEKMADIASKLWNKWLSSQSISFSASERQDMANFVAAMKLAGDVDLSDNPELKRKFTKMTSQMTKYLQCWAVTSLSAKSRIPFVAGTFDYVIIDEASQCDIASILPLLYRAKRAVIIGDPKQLSHISQLSRNQDLSLIQKYDVEPSWSYSANSLYDLAAARVRAEDIVQLKDHFRSCSDIIEFSNEVFYDGTLRTATRYDKLNCPKGEKPGIRWINTTGNSIRPDSGSAYNEAEVKATVAELKRLVKSGYTGSIGVTTPFRAQAEKIRTTLEKNEPDTYDILLRKHEFIADTVHKFQGDERDLMIFSAVVSTNTPKSTLGFLNSTGNLFNVAITRARAVLVVVGNLGYCAECEIPYLKKFASYYSELNDTEKDNAAEIETPDTREYPWVANLEQVSEWEKILYTALFDSGVKTIPQYPADRYKLDLAIILKNGKKLDIEVDGEMYHRSWNGELCYRDQLRNQRLFELGWDVRRFWVYQVRDQQKYCIQEISKWINDNKS